MGRQAAQPNIIWLDKWFNMSSLQSVYGYRDGSIKQYSSGQKVQRNNIQFEATK